MGKRGNRLNALSLLIIGAFIILGSRSVWASATHQPIESDGDGVDLIMLDISQQFGPLERPPVAFHHDRHTIALAKQSKDCLACHPEKDGKLVLTFKGSADLDKQAAMDLYHDNCIACHNEVARSGAQSGPVTCGECHSDNMPPASHRQSMQMDKYLHYEHTHALSDQCDLCHHQYNKETKTLVYVKGQEEACVYCHKAQSEENRISYSQAAHTQCIGCHRQRTAHKEQAGPMVLKASVGWKKSPICPG
jgi:mono/diheme cytochrome c family protein